MGAASQHKRSDRGMASSSKPGFSRRCHIAADLAGIDAPIAATRIGRSRWRWGSGSLKAPG
jgi:hypothetical protein